MKKRIGTKLYDTDTAICIDPEKGLYRTQRKQTYFLFDGKQITPIEYAEAVEMVTAMGGDHLLRRRADKKGNSMIAVSVSSANHLAEYCRTHGISQKKLIEDFIDSLPE